MPPDRRFISVQCKRNASAIPAAAASLPQIPMTMSPSRIVTREKRVDAEAIIRQAVRGIEGMIRCDDSDVRSWERDGTCPNNAVS
jgi:hypothetical protein